MLAIVSSFTHLVGHYRPYTIDFAKAFSGDSGLEAALFTAWEAPPEIAATNLLIIPPACLPITRFFLTVGLRAKLWNSMVERIVRNLEFMAAINAALKFPQVRHVFCVDARFNQLFREINLHPQMTFSFFAPGSPNALSEKNRVAYTNAFQSSRLTVIVETAQVADAWRPLAGDRVTTIPAAIHLDGLRISKADSRSILNIPADEIVFGCIGTHRHDKDYETVVKAALEMFPTPFLLFVGPWISGCHPEKLLRKYNHPKWLSLPVSSLDSFEAGVFAACDAIVLPYEQGYSKGSAVLLQAVKYNRPVITIESSFLGDFVRAHKNGVLYESGSVGSLKNSFSQMHQFLKHHGDTFSSDISATAEQYSWSRIRERYFEIFNRTVA